MDVNKRNIYLSNINLEEAKRIFKEGLEEFFLKKETEEIQVINSLGKITCNGVFAVLSSPNYNASAMDGIAVKATSTFGASEANPKKLILNKDFVYVDTGDPIMPPYDAVIMIEEIVEVDKSTIEIIKATSSWQHIRPIGEDIVAHEMIIPSNHKIRPVDIGAMLAGGIVNVEVIKRPKVGIIPTGTEIIEAGQQMELGKIIDSNSRMFESLVIECGGEANRYNPVADEYNLLKSKIQKAVTENDITLINAGSSAGSEDYTVKVIEDIGQVLVHGIATKPGKPAILGIVDNKPVIGIPGYPVSAYLVFDMLVKPLINQYLNQQESIQNIVEATLSKRLISSIKHREYVRIKLGKVGTNLIATPLNRGAGVTMSLVRADGILVIPQNSEGIEAGEQVKIQLMKNISDINNTIVSIGSHDLAMDIIGNIIHKKNSIYSLSSSHVGSMGGIMALKRGDTHIAPIHLLHEKSGVYNIDYIKRYLSNMDIVLIKGIKRIQGLIVRKQNPKKIRSISDLVRKEIQFVNRQRGAGTRILVDYILKQKNIDNSQINGYDREMTTHMAVAAAVASGTADVGVGVLSAAKAMDLSFIEIGEEQYDFAISSRYIKEDKINIFLDVLKSEEFKKELETLGGYCTKNSGDIIFI